jgi:hypothetical protein
MTNTPTRQLTVGERRVGLTFIPGDSPQANELKQLAAEFIDLCQHLRAPWATDTEQRLWALAETHIEEAAMWAVKAATKTPR